jgi:ribosomal protein L37AE/L43A
MKASAKYYGRDREWLEELKDGDTKSCQFCFKSIDRRVVKCPECGEIVDRAAYEKLTAKPPIPPPLNPSEKKQQAA